MEGALCGSGDARMTLDERCNLVLAFARTLFVNGQATDHTMAAAERLARVLGLRATLTARLGELLLHAGGQDRALMRRALARLSQNDFIQPFCAALLAGVIGGLAVRYDLSSSLRLIAVCPCMVLVPGPHFLNGVFDLIGGRIHLGAARLLYANLIVVAIS